MKFILLLALVGCAVNVQVTAAVDTLYGTYDADDRYAAENAAPPSINAAAADANLAAAAPYFAAAPYSAAFPHRSRRLLSGRRPPPVAAVPLTRTAKLEKILPSYEHLIRPTKQYRGKRTNVQTVTQNVQK